MFEWDDEKKQRNLAEHGLNFEDAEMVFAGPCITDEDRRRDYGEKRFITLAMKDEDIDYSEIPELDEAFFRDAKVVIPPKKKAGRPAAGRRRAGVDEGAGQRLPEPD